MKPDPRPRAPLTRSEDLLGREKERRRLLDTTRRKDPSGWQLWGPRRIGKTWLIDWLYLKWIADERPGPVHVRVRCQGIGEPTPVAFIHAVFAAIRRESPELGGLLPTALPVDNAVAGAALLEWVRDVQDYGTSVVFLVDEFDRLARTPACDAAFLGQLRCVEQEGNAAWVVTTTLPLAEVAHEDLRSSPFYNTLPQLPVGPFDEDESTAALRAWLGSAPDKGALSECFGQSGGWPMVLAMIARDVRHLDSLSLAHVQDLQAVLAEELAADLLDLVRAADIVLPGARAAFSAACARSNGPTPSKQVVHAMARCGLTRGTLGRPVPAWRCATSIIDTCAPQSRIEALLADGPLVWREWAGIASKAAVGLVLPPQIEGALGRLLRAADPLQALQDTRDLCVRLLERLPFSPPGVKLGAEPAPRSYSERTTKGARLAHLREVSKLEPLPEGVDQVLIWQLLQLDAAGNLGAHHGGAAVVEAEVGPLLMLAVEAVRRCG